MQTSGDKVEGLALGHARITSDGRWIWTSLKTLLRLGTGMDALSCRWVTPSCGLDLLAF